MMFKPWLFITFTFAFGSVNGWEYGHENVLAWSTTYPACGWNAQSPISIDHDLTEAHDSLGSFLFSEEVWQPLQFATLENTGQMIKFKDLSGTNKMTGSSLNGNPYTFSYLTIHFGSDSNHYGSQHWLNGKQYPGEIEFVFMADNVGSHSTVGDVAILSFFIDVLDSLEAGGSWMTLLDDLANIMNPGEMNYTNGEITLGELIPVNDPYRMNRFYRYDGSLSIPPCSQIAQWTVFQDPLYISKDQYEKLLDLYNTDGSTMMDTFRPTMPLNSRTVYRTELTSPKCKAGQQALFASVATIIGVLAAGAMF